MHQIAGQINAWLTQYVRQPGDEEDIILQKKIWWLFQPIGFSVILLDVIIIGPREGWMVLLVNFLFITCFIGDLILFHFYRKNIEWYALFAQVVIVVLSAVKVYLLGGLLEAGAPIYIGLIGPIYALTLPKKHRAIFIFLLYLVLMIGATILLAQPSETTRIFYYCYGFVFGNGLIFGALWYFTTQLDLLKREEKQRMQALDSLKTNFCTSITQEFRTPLTIILGMAEQVEGNPATWLQEGMQLIKKNGRKLLQLTNQLLDLSKLDAGAMPVHWVHDDVVVYIKYLVEAFEALTKSRKIQLTCKAEPECIRMDFDADKMQDILSNLLSNAIKFTPDSGEILVQIRVQETPEHLLLLSVQDTGTGIAPEDLPKVFNRYFQGEHKGNTLIEGTGLGLALTKELVTLLKGTIHVESPAANGVGSRFTIALPIRHQATAGLASLSGSRELNLQPEQKKNEHHAGGLSAAPEKLVVLIVDDNADLLKYLQALLAAEYHLETATNGPEALEKARAIIPDLVISDVMMPGLDGIHFCKQLKEDLRTSHIPVVLLTARADAASRVEGLAAGADAYLVKPFNRAELLVRIEKLIELRQTLQQRYQTAALPDGTPLPEPSPVFLKEDAFIEEVRRILEDHLGDEEFGIAELCRIIGISRSQLYRKFSALTNTTVHHFILERRLNKARELLLYSNLNVTQVAFETGFKNLSHFSKTFQDAFGYSPLHFRQQHLRDNLKNH